MGSSSIEITPELLAGFLDEAPEYLDMLDVGLMDLEGRAESGVLKLATEEDREQMNTMFRAAHSLKGLAAAFGFDRIKELTHRMETLFDQVRMNQRNLTTESFETLFRVFDRLKALVAELSDDSAPQTQIDDILAELDRILEEDGGKKDAGVVEGTVENEEKSETVSQETVLDALPPSEPTDKGPSASDASVPDSSIGESEVLNDPELLGLFVETTFEAIDGLSDSLLGLEETPANEELLNTVFRCAHNIKGASGTVGLMGINRLTHEMETVFDLLRHRRITLEADLMTTLLHAVDGLRSSLEDVRNGSIDESKLSDMRNDLSKWIASSSDGVCDPGTGEEDNSGADHDGDLVSNAKGDGDGDNGNATSVDEGGLPADGYDDDLGENELAVTITFADGFAEAPIQAYLIFNKLSDLGTVLTTEPDLDALDPDKEIKDVTFTIRSSASASEIERIIGTYSVERVRVSGADSLLQADASESNAPVEATPALAPTSEAVTPSTGGSPKPMKNKQAPDPGGAPNRSQAQTPAKRPSSPASPKGGGKGEKPAPVKAGETLRVDQERLDQLMNLGGELVINRARFSQIHGKFRTVLDTGNANYIVEDMGDRMVQLSDRLELLRAGGASPHTLEEVSGDLRHLKESFQSVRTLVQHIHELKPAMYDFDEALHGLRRVSEGIQKGIMGTRMVAVGPMFGRFRRVVRDVSKSSGKKIDLVLRGEHTELDKRMIDELVDPLTHMVRNSVDHGIEMPDVREAAGKNPTGTVILEASHRGNSIWIEVSDDGGGIHVDRVKAKAVEKGLATQVEVDAMTHREIIQFVLQPGFSTAPTVTDLSGRGMGMDIVKSKIDNLSGTVEIDSTPGQGTRVIIKLPITLAILTSMVARIGEGVYALPLETVVEIITVRRSDIQHIQRKRVVQVRDRVVPIVLFEDIFSTSLSGLRTQSKEGENLTLVIVGFENDQIGLVVDQLYGQDDVVIKSLAENYRNVRGIAGASIRGDGTVSLILDIATMMEMASKNTVGDVPAAPTSASTPATTATAAS